MKNWILNWGQTRGNRLAFENLNQKRHHLREMVKKLLKITKKSKTLNKLKNKKSKTNQVFIILKKEFSGPL